MSFSSIVDSSVDSSAPGIYVAKVPDAGRRATPTPSSSAGATVEQMAQDTGDADFYGRGGGRGGRGGGMGRAGGREGKGLGKERFSCSGPGGAAARPCARRRTGGTTSRRAAGPSPRAAGAQSTASARPSRSSAPPSARLAANFSSPHVFYIYHIQPYKGRLRLRYLSKPDEPGVRRVRKNGFADLHACQGPVLHANLSVTNKVSRAYYA